MRVCVLFPLKRLRNVFVTCRDYDPLDSLPPPSPRNTKYFPSNPLVITQVIKQANSQKRVSGKHKRVIYDDDAIAAAVASKYAGHKRPCLILLLLFLLSLLLFIIYYTIFSQEFLLLLLSPLCVDLFLFGFGCNDLRLPHSAPFRLQGGCQRVPSASEQQRDSVGRPACPIITTSDQPNRFFFTNNFPTNYTVSLCNHVIIMKKKKETKQKKSLGSCQSPALHSPYPDEIYTFHQGNRRIVSFSTLLSRLQTTTFLSFERDHILFGLFFLPTVFLSLQS